MKTIKTETLSQFIERLTPERLRENFHVHTFKDGILEITEYIYLRGGGSRLNSLRRYEIELDSNNIVTSYTKIP